MISVMNTNIKVYAKCLKDLNDQTLTHVIDALDKCTTDWDVIRISNNLSKSARTVEQVLSESIRGILNGDKVYPAIIRNNNKRHQIHSAKDLTLSPLGKCIIDKIDELGISKIDAAREMGVAPSTLSRWLYGHRHPQKDHMRAVERFIDAEI